MEWSSHLERFSQVLSESKIQPVLYKFRSRKFWRTYSLIRERFPTLRRCQLWARLPNNGAWIWKTGELRRHNYQSIDYLLFVFFSSIERPRFDILLLQLLQGSEQIKVVKVAGWKNGRLKREEDLNAAFFEVTSFWRSNAMVCASHKPWSSKGASPKPAPAHFVTRMYWSDHWTSFVWPVGESQQPSC